MATEDTRIVLRGGQSGSTDDLIVDHPQQPADYIHPFPDGPVWTWHQEWRLVGGVRLRIYDLVARIMLRLGASPDDDLFVDHPGQPADYTHTDGTVWTWHQRWRLVDGFRDDNSPAVGRFHTHVRAYDRAS